jgi:hypothetical protein
MACQAADNALTHLLHLMQDARANEQWRAAVAAAMEEIGTAQDCLVQALSIKPNH